MRTGGRRAPGRPAAIAAGLLVQRWAVAGSIGTGRSFAQVDRYSAELSDFVTRGVGSGVEELVFVGWLTPLVALVGLVADSAKAWPRHRCSVFPCCCRACSRSAPTCPGYETLWHRLPGLDATRVPERFMPIACLALAALVALGIDHLATLVGEPPCPDGPCRVRRGRGAGGRSARGRVRRGVGGQAQRGVCRDPGDGRLLELPVFRPDVHFGSAYLAYARQSPRERPQGYSTLAAPRAVGLARELRGLACGHGVVPPALGIRFVTVHRGLYAQSGFFGSGCRERAEAKLREDGWRLLARDGPIASYTR